MRKINKQIIILSIVLASVFVSNSNLSANSATSTFMKKGHLNKNNSLTQINKTAIENSLKNNDYNLFIATVKGFGITETVTNDQFKVLVSAYTLFKSNKSNEAIKLLQDNKVNPILIKFINIF